MKWVQLSLLAVVAVLAMTLWFSASAVVPQLRGEWDLGGLAEAWLTMSVQIGFVAGAILSAVLNLPDRLSARKLIGISALAGAAMNAAIPFLNPPVAVALAFRFLTGFFIAGIYPPGMKLASTWTVKERGLAIGILVGALTLGSAAPHLFNVFGEAGLPSWRTVLYVTSGMAVLAAVLVLVFVRTGPHLSKSAPFDWKHAGKSLADRPLRLANFGYLGHMWELYAMWTWVPFLLIASYARAGWDPSMARLAGFAAVGSGAIGCVVAGLLADRLGRTRIASASLLLSGACCVIVGFLFEQPLLLTIVCVAWGIAVVADSAQFSASVSELSDPRYVGTALTMQTSMGFLLTLVTIQVVPPLVDEIGWRYVFLILVPGPVFGIVSMLRLRGLPEAEKMASGHR